MRREPRATVHRVETFAGEALLLHGTGSGYEARSEAGAFSLKMVRSGTATWRVGRRTLALHETLFAFLPPGTRYTISIDADSPAETACLFFSREMLAMANGALLENIDTQPRDVDGWHLERCAAETQALHRLLTLVTAPTAPRPEVLDAVLAEDLPRLFAMQMNLCPTWDLPAARAATRQELRRRVLRGRDFLLDNIGGRVDLRSAASEAGLSAFHFHRTFKTLFKAPPLRYLAERRLERAAFLLRFSTRPVTEVSLDCGYESLGSFSRAFVARFGTSPGRYRRRDATELSSPLSGLAKFSTPLPRKL